jgi:hypothetical protein
MHDLFSIRAVQFKAGWKAGGIVKRALLLLVAFLSCVGAASAQEKGVDTQNARIRDAGSNRGPANNGTRQDVGAGRGVDFGKGRTPATIVLPNPYRLTARKDTVIKAIEDLMRERKLILDTSASRPGDGVLISQPFTFIRGAVVAESELTRYADLPSVESRGWSRGRYTMIVEVQPVDGVTTNVSVNSKIEGRSDGASGAEWVTLISNGTAEQEFLNAVVGAITGNAPNELPKTTP